MSVFTLVQLFESASTERAETGEGNAAATDDSRRLGPALNAVRVRERWGLVGLMPA